LQELGALRLRQLAIFNAHRCAGLFPQMDNDAQPKYRLRLILQQISDTF